MAFKKIIQFTLITFVVLSIVYLISGEKNNPNRSEDMKTVSETDIKNNITKIEEEKTEVKNKTGDNTIDPSSNKKIKDNATNSKDVLNIKDSSSKESLKHRADENIIHIYYFHGTRRCYTCLRIEALAKKTIEDYYALNIAAGKIRFDSINVEKYGNRHFIRDFNLYTSSIIITEKQGEKVVRWKLLPDVWRLVRYDAMFSDYIKKEIDKYLTES